MRLVDGCWIQRAIHHLMAIVLWLRAWTGAAKAGDPTCIRLNSQGLEHSRFVCRLANTVLHLRKLCLIIGSRTSRWYF